MPPVNQHIPAISGQVPAAVKQPLEAIRSVINNLNGKNSPILTRAQLANTGVFSLAANGALVSKVSTNDLATMPPHTGLVVTGAFASIFVEWYPLTI
ncbi:MAG: hypothetical protein R8M45_08905, partial [Ghiorsea sp.]